MLIRKLLTIIISISLFISIFAEIQPAHQRVSLGVDQLMTEKYINLVKGKRVAIVANNASRDSYGQRDITLLYRNPHIKLVSIFTPEHGLNVNSTNSDIANSYDPITHLPVYSLYGQHR